MIKTISTKKKSKNERDHITTIVSITGKSSAKLHVLANLASPDGDPEEIWSVVGNLAIKKPVFDGEVIYDVGVWLTGMDESSQGNLFCVSTDGMLYAQRKGKWQTQDLNCPDGLDSVWVAGDDEYFAVGGGSIYQYDDKSWWGKELNL